MSTALKALERLPAETGLQAGEHMPVAACSSKAATGFFGQRSSHKAWRLQKWSETIPSTQRTCTSEPIYRLGFS